MAHDAGGLEWNCGRSKASRAGFVFLGGVLFCGFCFGGIWGVGGEDFLKKGCWGF